MNMPTNSQWLIVTVNRPVMFHQTYDETWLLNPNHRYILNASRVGPIEPFIETVSEFNSAPLHQRLTSGKDVTGAKILIERNRERGIGDLLFMTGPLGYLHHISGNNVQIDLMSFADRGVALSNSPLLNNGCVKCGVIEYDSLRMYNYHWFVNAVTEHDSEPDQFNVYDALYHQLGFNPDEIDAKWKRPSVQLIKDDYQNLDMTFRRIWDDKKLELRRIGYYVVAPFANANLRCIRYSRWLEIIRLLSTRRPVVVVGSSNLRLPDTDMSAGDFAMRVGSMGQAVISAVDSTSIRVLMALISRATCLVGLDSAPLYMAQAVNTPAVSIWGTHPPGSRLGYDKAYMDLALWPQDACSRCPCFAYGHFPVDKCPQGAKQMICEVSDSVMPEDVLAKVDAVENAATLPKP